MYQFQVNSDKFYFMPKLTQLLLLEQVAFPPTVSATDHPGTAIIHGDVTWTFK